MKEIEKRSIFLPLSLALFTFLRHSLGGTDFSREDIKSDAFLNCAVIVTPWHTTGEAIH